ncbi:MAG TPA: fibrobacter succinogenes major paralogous domain-containing protein [Parafilimonas sp.]|nr:fibrobacter succinogenes major paralogous domain-containing protein [Parafilimonas sp.]
MKKIITVVAVIVMVAACKKDSVPTAVTGHSSTDVKTDINDPGVDGYIQIGTQKWMTKNLDVNHYRNGDHIPQVRRKADWSALKTGAWCWYNNDSATGAVYGKLYNWYAVNDPRGLAPTGWHVPSDAEWVTLATNLGDNPGGKLKDTGTIEAGTGLWYAPNTGATNETGFTGLPGGWRSAGGAFIRIGDYGFWWSSTQDQNIAHYAFYTVLFFDLGGLGRGTDRKRNGYSVRCLRD